MTPQEPRWEMSAVTFDCANAEQAGREKIATKPLALSNGEC
jgi:hypothetical protein